MNAWFKRVLIMPKVQDMKTKFINYTIMHSTRNMFALSSNKSQKNLARLFVRFMLRRSYEEVNTLKKLQPSVLASRPELQFKHPMRLNYQRYYSKKDNLNSPINQHQNQNTIKPYDEFEEFKKIKRIRPKKTREQKQAELDERVEKDRLRELEKIKIRCTIRSNFSSKADEYDAHIFHVKKDRIVYQQWTPINPDHYDTIVVKPKIPMISDSKEYYRLLQTHLGIALIPRDCQNKLCPNKQLFLEPTYEFNFRCSFKSQCDLLQRSILVGSLCTSYVPVENMHFISFVNTSHKIYDPNCIKATSPILPDEQMLKSTFAKIFYPHEIRALPLFSNIYPNEKATELFRTYGSAVMDIITLNLDKLEITNLNPPVNEINKDIKKPKDE